MPRMRRQRRAISKNASRAPSIGTCRSPLRVLKPPQNACSISSPGRPDVKKFAARKSGVEQTDQSEHAPSLFSGYALRLWNMPGIGREQTSEPWRVGVLFSRTGYMALIEETQYRGTMLAIDEINEAGGINGRELVPAVFDPGSDNAQFRAYTRKMLAEDGIRTIFGCYTSSSRKAVLPIVERLNGLLWYPTLYEGFEYSPNIIYTGAAPNQNSLTLFNYLAKNYGRRFYF